MDRDSFGGSLVFYINEQIPRKVLTLKSIPRYIEIILLDFTAKNWKWLCIWLYKPPSQNEKYFLDHRSKALGQLTCQFEKTSLIGDFKLNFNLTCFQSSNQRCIDLILTNKKEVFKNIDVSKVEIYDLHRNSFKKPSTKNNTLSGL